MTSRDRAERTPPPGDDQAAAERDQRATEALARDHRAPGSGERPQPPWARCAACKGTGEGTRRVYDDGGQVLGLEPWGNCTRCGGGPRP